MTYLRLASFLKKYSIFSILTLTFLLILTFTALIQLPQTRSLLSKAAPAQMPQDDPPLPIPIPTQEFSFIHKDNIKKVGGSLQLKKNPFPQPAYPIPDELQTPLIVTTKKIVCPEGSTDSDCQYFGSKGIQKAIDDAPVGSRTSATGIMLKRGTYHGDSVVTYTVYDENGVQKERKASYLIGGTAGEKPKHIVIEGLEERGAARLQSALGTTNDQLVEGIVVTSGIVNMKHVLLSDVATRLFPSTPSSCVNLCVRGNAKVRLFDMDLEMKDDEGVNVLITENGHVALFEGSYSGSHNQPIFLLNGFARLSALHALFLMSNAGTSISTNSDSELYLSSSSIDSNVIDNSYGIVQADRSKSLIVNSDIRGVSRGVQLQNLATSNIELSIMHSNYYALAVFGDSKAHVYKSHFFDNIISTIWAGYMQGKASISLVGNTIDGGRDGISVRNGADAQIVNNTLINQTTVGIDIVSGKQNPSTVDVINNIVAFTSAGGGLNPSSGIAYNMLNPEIKDPFVNIKNFRGNWAFNSESAAFDGFKQSPQWLEPDKLNKEADPQFAANSIALLKSTSPARTAGYLGAQVGGAGTTLFPPEKIVTKTVFSFIEAGGAKIYSKTCDEQSTLTKMRSCTKLTSRDVSDINEQKRGNNLYSGIAVLNLNYDWGVNELQEIIARKYTASYISKYCAFGPFSSGVKSGCSKWDKSRIEYFRIPESSTLVGLDAYSEKKGDYAFAVLSALTKDPAKDVNTVWSVSCQQDQYLGVLINTCKQITPFDLRDIRTINGKQETFKDMDSWYDGSRFFQALITSDSQHLEIRVCPVTDTGIQFSSCSAFERLHINQIPMLRGIKGIDGIDSYSYQVKE